MTYEQIAQIIEENGDRRLAGFIRKYYIEHKTIDEIVCELYINTHWGFYSMKRRAVKAVRKLYKSSAN